MQTCWLCVKEGGRFLDMERAVGYSGWWEKRARLLADTSGGYWVWWTRRGTGYHGAFWLRQVNSVGFFEDQENTLDPSKKE